MRRRAGAPQLDFGKSMRQDGRSMDSRERVQSVLAGEKPDRVPFNFWMDRRLMAQYARRYGGPYFRVTHFGADVIETFPLLDWPRGPCVDHEGTEWQTGPLIHDWSEADGLRMPDTSMDCIWDIIHRDLTAFPDKAVFLDVITPWGIAAGIRTYELMMTDMVLHPEAVKRLLGRLERVYVPVVERACRMGITALYLMEDIASTQGLMFAPEMIREFCIDYVRSLVEIARSYGIPVVWHTDGKAMDACELFVELGVAAVNPLQPHLNDLGAFRQRYNGRLALYGGLDNCYVIPNGGPEDVRRHVIDTFDRVGRGGGLIFSTHDIPIGTPEENVTTMVRAIVDECVY
jgi:hypothetical protein